MEDRKLKSTVTVLQSPRAIAKTVLKQPIPEDLTSPPMPEMTEQQAGELLIALADGLAEENATFATLLTAQQAKEPVTRSADAIEILGKAYELAKDHWGEFMFLITYLDRKGSFDKLKKKKAWRDFFGVLLEEE